MVFFYFSSSFYYQNPSVLLLFIPQQGITKFKYERKNKTNSGFSSKGLFTWSGGPRSSGVGFFCFHALGDTKQKKLTPVDRGPPLRVNRV